MRMARAASDLRCGNGGDCLLDPDRLQSMLDRIDHGLQVDPDEAPAAIESMELLQVESLGLAGLAPLCCSGTALPQRFALGLFSSRARAPPTRVGERRARRAEGRIRSGGARGCRSVRQHGNDLIQKALRDFVTWAMDKEQGKATDMGYTPPTRGRCQTGAGGSAQQGRGVSSCLLPSDEE
jgi:hypothetical protein